MELSNHDSEQECHSKTRLACADGVPGFPGRDSEDQETNPGIRILNAPHATIACHDGQTPLFRLRAYPQVVLVNLKLLPCRLVNPVLHPTRPVSTPRVSQVLAGKRCLQFSISRRGMLSKFKHGMTMRLRQHLFQVGRMRCRIGFSQPYAETELCKRYRRYINCRSWIEVIDRCPHITVSRVLVIKRCREGAGVEEIPGHDQSHSIVPKKVRLIGWQWLKNIKNPGPMWAETA